MTHINVSNRKIPSFAYLICENDGELFVPIFDINNIVLDFKTINCNTPLIRIRQEQQIEIEKGDQGLFAYYTVDNILIADAEELVIQLLELSKKQSMSQGCLRSFEAFAKKYNVYTIYLREYCKHYGYSDETIKLLMHAATDNTNIWAKKWAIKTWTSLQEQHPKLNSKICLNHTLKGEIRVSFEEESNKNSLACENCNNSSVVIFWPYNLKKPNIFTQSTTETPNKLQNIIYKPTKHSFTQPSGLKKEGIAYVV
ncbi:MAG: hypothetical protein LBD23_12740 [Oscillospiraceae bacterium]|nr:hypothetical protein [Oscillospiraceae bacterium]